jgi:hypothetical protein
LGFVEVRATETGSDLDGQARDASRAVTHGWCHTDSTGFQRSLGPTVGQMVAATLEIITYGVRWAGGPPVWASSTARAEGFLWGEGIWLVVGKAGTSARRTHFFPVFFPLLLPSFLPYLPSSPVRH